MQNFTFTNDEENGTNSVPTRSHLCLAKFNSFLLNITGPYQGILKSARQCTEMLGWSLFPSKMVTATKGCGHQRRGLIKLLNMW